MIDLSTFFKNHFDTARNNQLGKKGAFALDHIGDPQGGTALFDQTIVADKEAKPATP